jgi:hypothetical protein
MSKPRRLTVFVIAALPLVAAGLVAVGEPAANQLSKKERQEGWELLFDGKSLAGWRGYQKPDAAGLRWTAADGCLSVPANDGKDTRGARDLVSVKQYDSFDLSWEWRVAPGGNSGLKYLVTEEGPAALGHEYQMIDDTKHPDAQKRDSRRTGSFYDVLPAPTARPRPAGELNQSRVLLQGNHVEHWLNGAKVLEYELDSPALRTAIAASKFKSVEGFDKARRAHLLLQDHGNAICYRNMKIRPLKQPVEK